MTTENSRSLYLETPGQQSSASLSSTSHISPRTPSTPSGYKGLNSQITNKVSGVLASSYADTEFRDSLALLDSRHVQNNAETRRRLRLDIQKEVIDSNGEVISEFGRVAEQLRRLGNIIDKLNQTYGHMKSEIAIAHSTTEADLSVASRLMDQRRTLEMRQQLLHAFVDHFVLNEEQIASLTLTVEPIDANFFSVLTKAKKIVKDCEILLGSEDNQSLGSEIMEQTSKNINLGFQKLYKWVQREFKGLNLENPQIGPAMNRALRVLAERPSLFQSCLYSFAEARESILSDAFLTALTGHAQGNSRSQASGVRPIELAAHDTLRYAGDMLAWTHSATVSEREALETLFVADGDELARGIQEGRENEVWRLAAEDEDDTGSFDPIKALNDLVDRDLSGVAQILRQRMEQVIQSNEDIILSYKLANLLNFYRLTFTKLLSNNAVVGTLSSKAILVECLDGLETEALRHFRSLIRDHVAFIGNEFEHAPADSSPPIFLQESLEQLVAIMKTYDTSLTPLESREFDFSDILVEALDPFLAGCEKMADRATDPVSSLVFSLNYLTASRETLSRFDFTKGRVEKLQDAIDNKASSLADCQYDLLSQQSGLHQLFAALAPLTTSMGDLQKAITSELLQPQNLVQASQNLDDFLPSALMDANENVKALLNPKLARQLTEEAVERFCTNFEHIEEILDGVDRMLLEKEEDKDPGTLLRALFPRTTVEIRVLLS